ncbi:MAG: hypothetical protein AAF907_05125, partial [Planctomycetota bacterium]
MLASFTLLLAVSAADYSAENTATGVQTPIDQQVGGRFTAKTISAADARRLNPLGTGDLRTLARYVGEVKTVRGTCTAAFGPRGGSVLVLNFDRNYRNAMTAPIFAADFSKWPGGEKAIERAYVGKTLVIQGLVTEYRGAPQIKIAHPG